MDRDRIDSNAGQVLAKFESLLNTNESNLIKYYFLKKNSIILLDNARFLHGRTKINDLNRHLVRMRFQSKYDELLPVF